MDGKQAYQNVMARAEARKAGRFAPRNGMFLNTADGKKIVFTPGENPDDLEGNEARDEKGELLRAGRYTLADYRVIRVNRSGKVTECYYDPLLKYVNLNR